MTSSSFVLCWLDLTFLCIPACGFLFHFTAKRRIDWWTTNLWRTPRDKLRRSCQVFSVQYHSVWSCLGLLSWNCRAFTSFAKKRTKGSLTQMYILTLERFLYYLDWVPYDLPNAGRHQHGTRSRAFLVSAPNLTSGRKGNASSEQLLLKTHGELLRLIRVPSAMITRTSHNGAAKLLVGDQNKLKLT